jgi:hypothetical protein
LVLYLNIFLFELPLSESGTRSDSSSSQEEKNYGGRNQVQQQQQQVCNVAINNKSTRSRNYKQYINE